MLSHDQYLYNSTSLQIGKESLYKHVLFEVGCVFYFAVATYFYFFFPKKFKQQVDIFKSRSHPTYKLLLKHIYHMQTENYGL